LDFKNDLILRDKKIEKGFIIRDGKNSVYILLTNEKLMNFYKICKRSARNTLFKKKSFKIYQRSDELQLSSKKIKVKRYYVKILIEKWKKINGSTILKILQLNLWWVNQVIGD
jgi:hypothetical protein